MLISGHGGFPEYWLFRDAQLNWDLTRSQLPEARDLFFLRVSMAYLFVLSAVIIGRLVAPGRGELLASAVATLILNTSYFHVVLTRVMTEPAMILSLSVTTSILALIVKKFKRDGGLRWAILIGLVCGVSMATKHNMAASLIFVSAAFVGIPVVRHAFDRHMLMRSVARATIFAAVALLTFVALSPVLHPAPLERAIAMIQRRATLIFRQQAQFPQTALTTPAARIDRSANRLLNTYTWLSCARPRSEHVRLDWQTNQYVVRLPRPSAFAESIFCQPLVGWLTPVAITNALLAIGGLLVTLRRAQRTALTFTLFYGAHALVSITFIPHDWLHYHVIPAMLIVTLESVAVVTLAAGLLTFLGRRLHLLS